MKPIHNSNRHKYNKIKSVNTMSKIQNETNSQLVNAYDFLVKQCEYYVKDTK